MKKSCTTLTIFSISIFLESLGACKPVINELSLFNEERGFVELSHRFCGGTKPDLEDYALLRITSRWTEQHIKTKKNKNIKLISFRL